MNTLIPERHNHSESCIKVKKTRRTQKFVVYLANERSGLVFLSTDMGHIFDRNVAIKVGVLLRGKGPHQREFAYEIVRIHSFMVYTDLIENNILGDTKAPLRRRFLVISRLKLETL